MAYTIHALARLPMANKDTLAFLIIHLQNVAQHSRYNNMSLTDLAEIFAPIIVGNASQNAEMNDFEKQIKVMGLLLAIPQSILRLGLMREELLRKYISRHDNPQIVTEPGSFPS